MLFIELLDFNPKERCLIILLIILLNSDALEDIYYLLKMKCLIYEKLISYFSNFFTNTYPVNLLIIFFISIYDEILCKKLCRIILNAFIDLNLNYILNVLILSIISNLYIDNDLIKDGIYNISYKYLFNSQNYSI